MFTNDLFVVKTCTCVSKLQVNTYRKYRERESERVRVSSFEEETVQEENIGRK